MKNELSSAIIRFVGVILIFGFGGQVGEGLGISRWITLGFLLGICLLHAGIYRSLIIRLTAVEKRLDS